MNSIKNMAWAQAILSSLTPQPMRQNQKSRFLLSTIALACVVTQALELSNGAMENGNLEKFSFTGGAELIKEAGVGLSFSSRSQDSSPSWIQKNTSEPICSDEL